MTVPEDFVNDIVGQPDPDLWSMRPVLTHIRDAAHSRGISAHGLLGAVEARVCAAIPPTYTIPPIVATRGSLNTFVCLVGRPGSSKTAANAVAKELIMAEADVDGIGVSSGEGLIELYLGQTDEDDNNRKSRGQVNSTALVIADEGTVLADITNRKGNTTLSYLRSMWSGTDVGQANASKNRYRFLQAHSYRLALVVGIQPTRAQALLDDTSGGLPQRFVWCSATDDTIPPPGERPAWPGSIRWAPPPASDKVFEFPDEVKREIQERHYRRQLGEDSGLDAHAHLVCLKHAAILAMLEGRETHVTVEDWEIAELIHRRSTSTRRHIISELAADAQRREQETTDRSLRREAAHDDAREQRAKESMAKSIANKVHKLGVVLSRNELRKATGGKHRKHASVDDAISLAEERSWIKACDGGWTAGSDQPS